MLYVQYIYEYAGDLMEMSLDLFKGLFLSRFAIKKYLYKQYESETENQYLSVAIFSRVRTFSWGSDKAALLKTRTHNHKIKVIKSSRHDEAGPCCCCDGTDL